MRLVAELLTRLRSLLWRSREDAELDEEIRFHIDREAERIRRSGVGAKEARRIAYTRFGGVERMRERTREARGMVWAETAFRDVRVALRQLMRQRGFATVAVLTIAVGIGANAAIFAVVRAVLLEPLPFDDPHEVVVLRESGPSGSLSQVAPGTFLDWQGRAATITGLAAHQPTSPILIDPDGAEAIRGGQVTAGLLPMLGVPPRLGRYFEPEEAEYGSDAVVVLSHGLWVRRFGADPGAVGRGIDLSGRSHTVVGVMPEGFAFPDRSAELWTPMVFVGARNPSNRQFRFLDVVGRLSEGATIEQARAELSAISAALAEEYPESKTGWSARVDRALDTQVADVRPALLVLLASAGLLFAVALANVAAMLLLRGTTRTREVATRLALGASRGRIVRQLSTESLLITVIGAVAGLALAALLIRVLPTYLADAPRMENMRLDGWVALFALGLTVVGGLTFAVGPTLQVKAGAVATLLRSSSRGRAGGVAGNRSRSVLVVGQVGVAVVLLISAGLLLKSLAGRTGIDPGFVAENAMRAVVTFPPYASSEERLPVYAELTRRLTDTPGIDAAGTVQAVPTSPSVLPVAYAVDDLATRPGPGSPTAAEYQVMPGYFEAMGVPLVAGRRFTNRDVAGSPEVAIVNETLARLHFSGSNPLGRRIRLANSEPEDVREIVGVVGDVRTGAMTTSPPPQVYLPFAQLENPVGGLVLVIRHSADAASVPDLLRNMVRVVRSDLPVSQIRPLTDDVSDALARERLVTWLVSVFATLALGLSALGVYGVVAYAAAQRTREMGVRMALGAERMDVQRLVLGIGARLTVLGIGFGVAASLLATRLLRSLLYDVEATDPTTFVVLPLLLALTSLLAAYVPARRVSGSDVRRILGSE